MRSERSRSLRSRLRSRCSLRTSPPRSSRGRLRRSRSGLAGAPGYAAVGVGLECEYAAIGLEPGLAPAGMGIGAGRDLRFERVGEAGERERTGELAPWLDECGFELPMLPLELGFDAKDE